MTDRIVLVLPKPVSANRYWRPVRIGAHISIVPTKEAKAYREAVASLARVQGCRCPIEGRIAVLVQLYPNRPQDWQTRQRKHGDAWDDTVQCIDIDNANKVVLDSLKGVAFVDDAWVRRLVAERMEPDERGARVVVSIEAYRREAPEQMGLAMPAQPEADEPCLTF